MKEFKLEIIEAVCQKADEMKIVSLYQVCKELGYNHVNSQDCCDILGAVQKRLPDYRPLRIWLGKGSKDLFTTLCFVENDVEFDDGEEFLED